PATGSASGALGVYLVRHRLVQADGPTRIVSEQGTKMRRQSFVHISLTARGTACTDIRVGGSVVPVIEGTVRIPSP
ncbi:MAG TPA: PhzF family phenazine biosynthesis protein, partial [Dongiaceae bacterium]|nr:PhzF family phenazine biosynthesis protein [Dongiaceae bacterium]